MYYPRYAIVKVEMRATFRLLGASIFNHKIMLSLVGIPSEKIKRGIKTVEIFLMSTAR